ncbi:V-type proton ATPase 16 kDa proteolipid subunit-like [Drosophila miranda]|uniref:V-type proton ATPase 16 kDa proteolipid subunit-like n=1 Tax=Drosophila miranda TaxID=7229 RepID=UPI00143F9BC9|nr:V-type proton ATPase 16 kDa proteolipid subunit-like [Drosophila miranda]
MPRLKAHRIDPEATLDQPKYAFFFCIMGAVSAIVFSTLGAAYGTAKSAIGISSMAVKHPESIIPVVMAGIIAIYGLVVSVLLTGSLIKMYPTYKGFLNLGAGLAVGLSGMAAGFAIGVVGDAGVRAAAQQPKLFVGLILIQIFSEVLGLYGLIVAIYLFTK